MTQCRPAFGGKLLNRLNFQRQLEVHDGLLEMINPFVAQLLEDEAKIPLDHRPSIWGSACKRTLQVFEGLAEVVVTLAF